MVFLMEMSRSDMPCCLRVSVRNVSLLNFRLLVFSRLSPGLKMALVTKSDVQSLLGSLTSLRRDLERTDQLGLTFPRLRNTLILLVFTFPSRLGHFQEDYHFVAYRCFSVYFSHLRCLFVPFLCVVRL